ncbi:MULTISPECIES: sensor histidine kinase [unclassified Marinobacter]|uniref:sensor histidine kinase n=1 Tax=unclassified Marinobacter TaxID=83889 RepID=UPI000BF5EB27|nr:MULTISPECIES: sensor histidine kinase [unclassified Marinobacter]PFG08008.1 two-component system sensor histidine kinase UhpB [Marinobacter sp. LV10MA510-1]PFG53827.1 two-component system sensor histidine kinase UhpB [Marinobacter sp. LV10R520-4]
MTAFRRVSLLMLTLFTIIYVMGGVLYVQQARFDIERELAAVSGLAKTLGAAENVHPEVVQSLRHMRPAKGPELAVDHEVPRWFANAVTGDRAYAVVNGWRIDPADEVEEVWEGFVLISASYTVGMLLCFLALFWMVKQGLRPLTNLAGAMASVADGCLASRLPGQRIVELDTLAQRFNQMVSALENEQKTVSRLLNELLQLQDREREHIARVLHDDLGQYLTGIRAQARSWVYDPELNERQKQQARDLAGHCETVQQHFRHLLQDLHPLVMEQLGLAGAIQHLAEQWQHLSGLDCQLTMDEQLAELSGEQQTHLYRFLQEALNNVSRHANATRATLAVKQNADELHIELCDNGAGADNFPEKAGLGLRSMRERARCMGGRAEFLSRVGEGTRIQLTVPLNLPCATGGML